MSGPCPLSDLVAEGVGVFLWCHACGRGATLDAAGLAKKLGPGFPVPQVASKCRCSRCGSANVTSRPDWRPITEVISRHPS